MNGVIIVKAAELFSQNTLGFNLSTCIVQVVLKNVNIENLNIVEKMSIIHDKRNSNNTHKVRYFKQLAVFILMNGLYTVANENPKFSISKNQISHTK